MTEPIPGGRRRIDRVLDEHFLDGLEQRPITEVRELRAEAEQEEADLSYVRRLLQGRIDIVRAEIARREGGESQRVIDHLAEILADDVLPARGQGRFTTVQPSRVDEHRRRVEAIAADTGLSDVENRSEEELAASLDLLRGEERSVSDLRRAVQRVADACAREIARRYAAGEARVEDVLPGA